MNLVTGATGHIGNVLIRYLVEQKQNVRALVMPGEDLTPLQDLPVEIFEGDVLDFGSLAHAMQNVDTVYHLAGVISILPGRDPFLRSVNFIGTRNVLHACRVSQVRRLVYTSSIHALARPSSGIIIDENIPFDPQHAISEYDYSKALASLEVRSAVQNGLDAVIVCPTGVIGPYDYRRSEIGQLILDCLRKKPQFYIDGAYDFVDVRDVAQGLAQAGRNGKTGEMYILSGEKITVCKLLDTIQEITGFRIPRLKVPVFLAKNLARLMPLVYRLARNRPRLTPYSIATLLSNSDISHAKASSELGYQPRPMVNSIRDTIAWLSENVLNAKFSTQQT